MAYEYNSQDQRFEFPNPYKVENIFKLIGSAIFLIAGILLLFSAKGALNKGLLAAMAPLCFGIFMLSYGGLLLARGLSNLKFYFGRDQPIGLSQELTGQSIGTAHGAQNTKEILRQSALSYQEPRGSVNGILYSIFPNLIFSPLFIRNAAEIQFQNAIVFVITLLSAVIAYFGASTHAAEWLGIFYNIIALMILLRPMAKPGHGAQPIGLSNVVFLIVIAILGPVIIPFVTQFAVAPEWLPSMGKALFTLIAALIAIGIFFMAVIAQMVKAPPQASAGMVQDSLSMNCQPMQLFDELERHLQNQWVSAIPNRIYSRILPQLELNKPRGSFEGEILEETQPVPINSLKDMTLASCFREKNYRWLAILNSFGLFCFVVSVILLCLFAKQIYQGQFIEFNVISYAFFGISMWILGKFCFDHGNYLWSRFDFVSDLIWVEAKGNYQLSKMDVGRYLDDSIKTQKEIINIESMTLRIWYAEITTTTFGKDQARSILSMVSKKDQALLLKSHLMDFVQDQSVIIAPTATGDLNRIQAINHLNASMGQANPTANLDPKTRLAINEIHQQSEQHTDQAMPITPNNTDTATSKNTLYCVSCGTQLEAHMKFCPQCGTQK